MILQSCSSSASSVVHSIAVAEVVVVLDSLSFDDAVVELIHGIYVIVRSDSFASSSSSSDYST